MNIVGVAILCHLSCVVIGCDKWVIFYLPCALLGLHLYFNCLRCCSHCVTCVAWMNSLFPPSSYNNITSLIKSAWALRCSVTQSLQYAVNPSGPPRSIHCLWHICCDCTGMSGKKAFYRFTGSTTFCCRDRGGWLFSYLERKRIAECGYLKASFSQNWL